MGCGGRDGRDPERVLLPLMEDERGLVSGGGGACDCAACSRSEGAGGRISSVVECFPVVQGEIERNSSKVKTRGLQHFQPVHKMISQSW